MHHIIPEKQRNNITFSTLKNYIEENNIEKLKEFFKAGEKLVSIINEIEIIQIFEEAKEITLSLNLQSKIKIKTFQSQTLLHMAICSSSKECIELLLANKADANLPMKRYKEIYGLKKTVYTPGQQGDQFQEIKVETITIYKKNCMLLACEAGRFELLDLFSDDNKENWMSKLAAMQMQHEELKQEIAKRDKYIDPKVGQAVITIQTALRQNHAVMLSKKRAYEVETENRELIQGLLVTNSEGRQKDYIIIKKAAGLMSKGLFGKARYKLKGIHFHPNPNKRPRYNKINMAR